jgi:GT2 family glycosyltransferase
MLTTVVTPLQCSIIILNWNGRDLLATCLPSVLRACRASRFSSEVIVVDNGSSDGSVAWVRTNFPFVIVVELVENVGFGEGNNIGVQHAKGEIVVLLNNDMVVDKHFLRPLIRGFQEEPEVFAVGAQIFFRDEQKRREETGKTIAFWDKGTIRFIHMEIGAIDEERKYVPITWASGGAAAFNRKKFDQLGGFRGIYSPA